MSNLMKGKVFGLSLPNKKTAMAPHLHNVIPKVNTTVYPLLVNGSIFSINIYF